MSGFDDTTREQPQVLFHALGRIAWLCAHVLITRPTSGDTADPGAEDELGLFGVERTAAFDQPHILPIVPLDSVDFDVVDGSTEVPPPHQLQGFVAARCLSADIDFVQMVRRIFLSDQVPGDRAQPTRRLIELADVAHIAAFDRKDVPGRIPLLDIIPHRVEGDLYNGCDPPDCRIETDAARRLEYSGVDSKLVFGVEALPGCEAVATVSRCSDPFAGRVETRLKQVRPVSSLHRCEYLAHLVLVGIATTDLERRHRLIRLAHQLLALFLFPVLAAGEQLHQEGGKADDRGCGCSEWPRARQCGHAYREKCTCNFRPRVFRHR